MTIAFVGIGSNLDDPIAQVRDALSELDQLPHTRVVKHSSLYRTAPVGHAAQPDFINAVAQLETALPAERLLAELQRIEQHHHRQRSFANAPRTLDLDVLLFGNIEVDRPGLRVPHPRMHERAFVLKPLAEIAPDTAIPGRGPVKALLEQCSEQEVERIA